MILNGPGISYTETDIGAEFVPELPENPRPSIMALCEHCTNRLLGRDKLLPYEYWSFAEAATDEQADMLCKLKMRTPYTLEAAVAATGIPAEKLEPMLDEVSYTGLLEYNWENPQHAKQWVLPMLVPGSAEFLNMRWSQLEEHPVFAKFFEQASKGPLSKATPMVPPGGAGIGMHVIPVERAIEHENQSISIEHIKHWLDKYDGKYAASACSCRMSRQRMGQGCGDDFNDWCIAVGDMADYVVETNRGRYITREEALEIFERAEENGFVHQITNIDGEHKIFAICNCNVNVCYALRTSQLFNTPNLSRSAYVAHVDAKSCVACGRCVEVCPAGAAKLGQKLCQKSTGKVPEYPRQELPDAVKWGPEKWSPNYRDDNRIETHESGTAPCKTACPAHIAVQGYLKLASQGRYQEALALIKRENPLPAVCGRVCNRRCEDACTRGRVDEAIAIDEVKKFIAQLDLDASTRYIPPQVRPKVEGDFDEKVAIIGAGPAGLSCAFYLAERGYKPVVFERSERPGGMLTYGIPAYKLGKEVIQAEVDVIEAMGAEFRYGVEVGRDVTLDELREQGFKAFYVAIGCQGGRLAGVPGEDAAGVSVAVDFLRGVASAQLTGSEVPPVGKRVVVVGGGNVAMDATRTAKRLGAASVTCVYRRRIEDMTAAREEIDGAIAEGCEIMPMLSPVRIETEDDRAVGIAVQPQLSGPIENGRPKPINADQPEIILPADVVITAIGQAIDSAHFESSGVGTERRRIKADPSGAVPGMPGVFTGGDCFFGPSTVVRAIDSGMVVAGNIDHYFGFHTPITSGVDIPPAQTIGKPAWGRVNMRERTAGDRKEDFNLMEACLTDEEAAQECSRCLRCDHYGYGAFRGGRKDRW